MVKNYKVKNDIIFSYIFSNEGILKEFLEAILDKKIEEASKLKEDFTVDGVTQEMLELYEKWDMDERTLKKEAREAGMAEGLAEGRTEGKEEGKKETKTEILKASNVI